MIIGSAEQRFSEYAVKDKASIACEFERLMKALESFDAMWPARRCMHGEFPGVVFRETH
jgi:hypothetical protein